MLGYSSDGELIGEGHSHSEKPTMLSRVAILVLEMNSTAQSMHLLRGCLIEVPGFGRQGDVVLLPASYGCDHWSITPF